MIYVGTAAPGCPAAQTCPRSDGRIRPFLRKRRSPCEACVEQAVWSGRSRPLPLTLTLKLILIVIGRRARRDSAKTPVPEDKPRHSSPEGAAYVSPGRKSWVASAKQGQVPQGRHNPLS